jgi:polyhydroxybutyrate depolymerase
MCLTERVRTPNELHTDYQSSPVRGVVAGGILAIAALGVACASDLPEPDGDSSRGADASAVTDRLDSGRAASPDAAARDGARPAPGADASAGVDAPRGILDAGRDSAPASSSGCTGGTLAAGRSTLTLQIDGLERTATVFAPTFKTPAQPLPLVLDFHGLGEGALLHELFSEWDDRVEQEQFIVVMPQGIGNSWNVGPCCTESRDVDDVKFARALVAKVGQDSCVDTTRVYATGYSNGGGMTLTLACRAADLFAAFGPAAFDLLEGVPCEPARPVPIFIHRGSDDGIVPYAGGPSTPPTLGYTLPMITFMGAVKTFETWQRLDGCTAAPTAEGECQVVRGCGQATTVALCTRPGGGHDINDPDEIWPQISPFRLP